jgi:hypothetical protein
MQQQMPSALVVGSRATVQLVPKDNSLLAALAKSQIELISLLHYVY